MKKQLTVSEAGRLGAKKTLELHGIGHMKDMAVISNKNQKKKHGKGYSDEMKRRRMVGVHKSRNVVEKPVFTD